MIQDCNLPYTSSVPDVGTILARNPLLSQHAIEQFTRDPRRRLQCPFAALVSSREIVQHPILGVLVFRGFLRPFRGPSFSCQMQRKMSLLGDPIRHLAPELSVQRQHGAKNFADRGKIVFADPFPQTQKIVTKRRRICLIEGCKNLLRSDRRGTIVQFGNDAHETLAPEGYNDALPEHWAYSCWHLIGEDHIK